jgi:hypothetical protein
MLVLKDHKAFKVVLVFLEIREQLDHKGLKGLKVYLELRE